MKLFQIVCVLTAVFVVGSVRAAEPAGKAVYDNWCLPCHRSGQVGSVQLQMRYKNALPAVLTERTDLQPALIKVLVRNGGKVMPIFRKTEISDVELDALADYLSTAGK